MEKIKKWAIVVTTALFIFGFALLGLIEPDTEVSTAERRKLAQLPQFSMDAVLSGTYMKNFESYSLDQFPGRDLFRRVQSLISTYLLRQKDNNGIYIAEGHAAKLEYPADSASLARAAERFRFLYDTYLKGKAAKVYLSVIPDKSFFLAAENGYPSLDYETYIDSLRKEMEYAEYLDILPLLSLDDYYRTDVHWRQEKITDVAQFLASRMGTRAEAAYETVKADEPFYGVYYGQSALPLAADDLYYLENESLLQSKVYDYETDSFLPVYDLARLQGNDPYELFLSGSKSLLTLENPASASERELILFRDSFGSSIAPLLSAGYRRITLVDIRYISPNLLSRFLTFEDQDVLFLYSTSVLNHSETIK